MIVCEGGRCSVQGPIMVDNVVALLGEGNERFTAQEVTVDLAAVTDVDSSALSLLLEWRREAGRNGRAIRYLNLPVNLRSLAELYGVAEFVGAA
jgi:phospholipid transport system transporter-binding protein